MIRKYIKDEVGNNVGLFVAFRDGRELKVGYSLLHPKDIAATKEYNARVKRANAESHRLNNGGGIEIGPYAPIEKYKPIFDKNKAFDIAYKTADSTVIISHQHPKIQMALHGFIGRAQRNLKGRIAVDW